MKKLLITGGDGYFGRRFREKYAGAFEILSTDKGDLDITDRTKVQEAIRDFKPDIVVHAAALLVTDFCETHPEICHDINVQGAVNVAEACRSVGARLVFISTEQVFNGNSEGGPYKESDVPRPNTVYGKNKLEAEKRLLEMVPALWTLRFAWTFGFPERNLPLSPNLFWDVIRSALRGERMRVAINEYRSLTYIYDIIDQFDKVFALPFGLYHVGSRNSMSRYEVACEILRLIGGGHRIDELLEKDADRYKGAPRDVRLDTSKIEGYGFVFSETREGLAKLVREFGLGK
jgi:dTDP-4-dehydrorhamnose reductase